MNPDYILLLTTLRSERSLAIDVVTAIINDLIETQRQLTEVEYALRPFALNNFDEADIEWAKELMKGRV